MQKFAYWREQRDLQSKLFRVHWEFVSNSLALKELTDYLGLTKYYSFRKSTRDDIDEIGTLVAETYANYNNNIEKDCCSNYSKNEIKNIMCKIARGYIKYGFQIVAIDKKTNEIAAVISLVDLCDFLFVDYLPSSKCLHIAWDYVSQKKFQLHNHDRTITEEQAKHISNIFNILKCKDEETMFNQFVSKGLYGRYTYGGLTTINPRFKSANSSRHNLFWFLTTMSLMLASRLHYQVQFGVYTNIKSSMVYKPTHDSGITHIIQLSFDENKNAIDDLLKQVNYKDSIEKQEIENKIKKIYNKNFGFIFGFDCTAYDIQETISKTSQIKRFHNQSKL